MDEKFRFLKPNRKKTEDKRQANHGERIKQEKVPINPISAKETLLMYLPEINRSSLDSYLALPAKFQNDIITDIAFKRRSGMEIEEILERFDVLVEQGTELNNMGLIDSDLISLAKLSPEREENKAVDTEITKYINRTVHRIERTLEQRKEDDEEDKSATLH